MELFLVLNPTFNVATRFKEVSSPKIEKAMKNILRLVCFSLVLPALVNAQSDVSLVDIKLSSDQNNWVPQGLKTSIEVTVRNEDALPIPAGDSILVSVQMGLDYYEAWITLTASLDSGTTITHNFGSSDRFHFTSSMDTVLVNAYAWHPNDSINLNNNYNELFISSTTVNNDWHAASMSIIKPSNLNFFDIDNGSNVPPPLSEVEINLVNAGSVTYLFGTQIEYSIYINNDVHTIVSTIMSESVGPNQTSTRIITNKAVLPAIPDSAGTYQFCSRTEVPNDLTPVNNAACMIFKIVDNYDPSDPSNWPFGVEDTKMEDAKIYMSNNQLKVETSSSYSLRLFDLSGKIILTEQLNGNIEMPMNNLEPGLYFVRLDHADGTSQTKKIIVN